MLLRDLALELGASLVGDGSINILGLQSLNEAKAGDLSFCINKDPMGCRASALLVKEPIETEVPALLIHPHPYWAMAKASQIFFHRHHAQQGVHPLSFVHPTADVADSTLYPFAYVDEFATIGPQSFIYPHVYVGAHVSVGSRCVLYPGTVLLEGVRLGDDVLIHGNTVIGSDGFGMAELGGSLAKIAHAGSVEIKDNVEIGAGCSIDRATFKGAQTMIEQGCKLDNQVHIGHNVHLGESSRICGQSGIAGSTRIGAHFLAGGQSGISHGLTIEDHVIVAASGKVVHNLTSGAYGGMPAIPLQQWKRQVALVKGIENLRERIRFLEEKVSAIVDQKHRE